MKKAPTIKCDGDGVERKVRQTDVKTAPSLALPSELLSTDIRYYGQLERDKDAGSKHDHNLKRLARFRCIDYQATD